MLGPGVDLVKDINNTKKEDRPWVISIISIIVCIALCTTTFFIFSSQKSQAVQDRIKAEQENSILRSQITTGANRCPDLIRAAEERLNLYWSNKFDNLDMQYKQNLQDQSERANKIQNEVNYLSRESKRIKTKSETIKNKVNEN